MAVSNSKSFNPELVELIEEAYEQAGLEFRTGYDFLTAKRSLDFLLLDWSNRGINLWQTDEEMLASDYDGNSLTTNFLEKDEKDYRIPLGTISVLDAILRENDTNTSTQVDYHLGRLSRADYANLPNKLVAGRPVNYYVERTEILGAGAAGVDRYGKIILWPVPDIASKWKVTIWRMLRMDDAGTLGSNTMQTPDRFLPALVTGLAFRIAMKKRPERAQILKLEYEDLFRLAAEEDRDKTPFRLMPKVARI